MKTVRSLGFVFMLAAFMFPLLAQQISALTDLEAGLASNVVETNGVIQVYVYDGLSSEFTSTFNEGEDWTTWVPVTQKTVVYKSNNTTSQADPILWGHQKHPLVEAVDKCIGNGNRWDHSDGVCVSNVIRG